MFSSPIKHLYYLEIQISLLATIVEAIEVKDGILEKKPQLEAPTWNLKEVKIQGLVLANRPLPLTFAIRSYCCKFYEN